MPNSRNISNQYLPHAKLEIVVWFCDFCERFFGENDLIEIYLLGSRSSGVSSKGGGVRPNSDHDFLVVISSRLDHDYLTGGPQYVRFSRLLDNERRNDGVTPIDFFIVRQEDFDVQKQISDTASYKAFKAKHVLSAASEGSNINQKMY